jgi:hypothetical protein
MSASLGPPDPYWASTVTFTTIRDKHYGRRRYTEEHDHNDRDENPGLALKRFLVVRRLDQCG